MRDQKGHHQAQAGERDERKTEIRKVAKKREHRAAGAPHDERDQRRKPGSRERTGIVSHGCPERILTVVERR